MSRAKNHVIQCAYCNADVPTSRPQHQRACLRPECQRRRKSEAGGRWKRQNKDRHLTSQRTWRERDRQRRKESKGTRPLRVYGENPNEKRLLRAAEKKKTQRALFSSLQAVRRARKRHATPWWVDRNALRAVYEECVRVSVLTGIPHQVDHIIPLTNKLVCGLHVPWNLQVIPRALNESKYNKFTP